MISNQLREALAAPRAREFEFGNEDFEALRKLVKEITGRQRKQVFAYRAYWTLISSGMGPSS